jgi:hypothetical protein
MLLAVAPLSAAEDDEPHIVDATGDANFVNGQGTVPGQEDGADTGPASLGGADLVAVWFTTDYATHQVVDGATGAVLRVEHHPTALLVHLQTAAPVHPTFPPNRVLRYEVHAAIGDCALNFQLTANGNDPSTAGTTLWTLNDGCDGVDAGRGMGSPVKPAFTGEIATLEFPLDDGYISSVLMPGLQLEQPTASVDARAHINFPPPVIDEAAPGLSFIIGEDVPPDIDCADEPPDPACGG